MPIFNEKAIKNFLTVLSKNHRLILKNRTMYLKNQMEAGAHKKSHGGLWKWHDALKKNRSARL